MSPSASSVRTWLASRPGRLVVEGDAAFDLGVRVEPGANLVDSVRDGEDGGRFAEWMAKAGAMELSLDGRERGVLAPARGEHEAGAGAREELVEEHHAAHVEGVGVPGSEHPVDVKEDDFHSNLRRCTRRMTTVEPRADHRYTASPT